MTVPAPALAGPERSLVEKALTFVQQQRNNLGFAAADPVEFVPDPTVQVTSVGAAAVHLQQYYRGLPVFQMARTVRFSPGGSSGGTVTAVAASMAVLGNGTDTGNSIRMPAATSALVGVFLRRSACVTLRPR